MKKWHPKEKVVYYVKQPVESNISDNKPHHYTPANHIQRGKKKHTSRVLQQIQNILTPSYVEKLVTKSVSHAAETEFVQIRIDDFGFYPSSVKIQPKSLVRIQVSSLDSGTQHVLAGLPTDIPVLKRGHNFEYEFSETGVFELYRVTDPAIRCRIEVVSESNLKQKTPEKANSSTGRNEFDLNQNNGVPLNPNDDFSLDSVIQNEILKEISNSMNSHTPSNDFQATRKTSSKKKATRREAKKQKKQGLAEISIHETKLLAEQQPLPSIFDPVSKDHLSFDAFLKLRSKEILRLEDLAHPTKFSFTEKELRDHQLAKNFLQNSNACSIDFVITNLTHRV